MKISVKQYARSLYEAVDGKSKAEQTAVIGRFLAMLNARGKFSLAKKIADEVEALALSEQGIVAAEVRSARPLQETVLKDLSQLIKIKTSCQEVRLTAKIDPAVLGGAVLKYEDKIINFSLQHFLTKIKQEMIK